MPGSGMRHGQGRSWLQRCGEKYQGVRACGRGAGKRRAASLRSGCHTSHFTFDESVLPRGLELLARLAVAALARRLD